jgi:hypothetical protein
VAPAYQYQHWGVADVRTFGTNVTSNLPGPLGLEVGYVYRQANAMGVREHAVRVRPALELLRGKASICTVAGAQYGVYNEVTNFISDGAGNWQKIGTSRTHEWLIPLGLGVGLWRQDVPVPGSAQLQVGGTTRIRATVSNAPAGVAHTVAWSVSNDNVLGLEAPTDTSVGVVGRAAGAASVIATLVADPSNKAAALVQASAP